MPSRKEYSRKAATEFHKLRQSWDDLFQSSEEEGFNASKVQQDMNHIPTALRELMDGVLAEGHSQLEEAMEHEDLAEGDESAYYWNGLYMLARFLGARMYQLGGRMSLRLPYSNLTPCPCSVLSDDELTDLLSEPIDYTHPDLRGDGWVIKEFNRKWQPKIRGEINE